MKVSGLLLILFALWHGPRRWSERRRRPEGFSEKAFAP